MSTVQLVYTDHLRWLHCIWQLLINIRLMRLSILSRGIIHMRNRIVRWSRIRLGWWIWGGRLSKYIYDLYYLLSYLSFNYHLLCVYNCLLRRFIGFSCSSVSAICGVGLKQIWLDKHHFLVKFILSKFFFLNLPYMLLVDDAKGSQIGLNIISTTLILFIHSLCMLSSPIQWFCIVLESMSILKWLFG